MQFTKEILSHANIRDFSVNLLNTPLLAKGEKEYEARLDEAYHKYEAVALRFDNSLDSELLDSAKKLNDVTKNVYTKIGMQAGFLIVQDIIENIGLLPDAENAESAEVNYRKMYEILLDGISDALEYLQKSDDDPARRAAKILKDAQCKAEQISLLK